MPLPPAIHGVVRWRLKDPALRVWEEFRVAVSERTLSRIQVEAVR